MSNLIITAGWNNTVNQIDNGEKLSGGATGNLNIAAKQLSENIFYLKEQLTGEINRATQKELELQNAITAAIPGINGTNGINGKSAYQSAKDAGFVGTEVAWLASLKGINGTNGINANISNISITALEPNEQPVSTLGGTQTNRTIAFGIPKGTKGDKGDKGDAGLAGTTILDINNNTPLQLWTGTQSQYDAVSPKLSTVLYLVKE